MVPLGEAVAETVGLGSDDQGKMGVFCEADGVFRLRRVGGGNVPPLALHALAVEVAASVDLAFLLDFIEVVVDVPQGFEVGSAAAVRDSDEPVA